MPLEPGKPISKDGDVYISLEAMRRALQDRKAIKEELLPLLVVGKDRKEPVEHIIAVVIAAFIYTQAGLTQDQIAAHSKDLLN